MQTIKPRIVMKYIDADKLRSVLQNTINSMKGKDAKGERYDAFLNGKLSICEELLGCIASLQQEQPVTKEPGSHLEHWLAFFGCPEENIEKCATQIAQGYGAIRYLEGVQRGAEAVNELAKQEQQEVDLNAEIEKELRLHYNDDQDVYWWNYLKNSFYHFYELGRLSNK